MNVIIPYAFSQLTILVNIKKIFIYFYSQICFFNFNCVTVFHHTYNSSVNGPMSYFELSTIVNNTLYMPSCADI